MIQNELQGIHGEVHKLQTMSRQLFASWQDGNAALFKSQGVDSMLHEWDSYIAEIATLDIQLDRLGNVIDGCLDRCTRLRNQSMAV